MKRRPKKKKLQRQTSRVEFKMKKKILMYFRLQTILSQLSLLTKLPEEFSFCEFKYCNFQLIIIFRTCVYLRIKMEIFLVPGSGNSQSTSGYWACVNFIRFFILFFEIRINSRSEYLWYERNFRVFSLHYTYVTCDRCFEYFMLRT